MTALWPTAFTACPVRLSRRCCARAAEATALFFYRAGRAIGSLAAALGGLGTLVFTASIGEYAPRIHALICQNAAWLGARMDTGLNTLGKTVINDRGLGVEILVIPADEQRACGRGQTRRHRSAG